MVSEYGSDPETMFAGFGPCMRGCCYEVGGEFAGRFSQGLLSRGGVYYLDLPAINAQQLCSAGIDPRNILDSGICTSCQHADYYSYRKDGPSCGRLLSVIMLR
jgi:copper oxidase (laccase) domain-containing protein